MKKGLAIVLSLILCISLLAGCGGGGEDESEQTTGSAETVSESTEAGGAAEDPGASLSPAEKIAGSYYSYAYDVDTMYMTYFFHFYNEIPGVGNLYYAGFAMNQITFSGKYEVVEQETEYACWPDRAAAESAGEGATPPTGTAPYTVNFYDMDGNLVDSCGFDGDNLYMDMEAISGVGGEDAIYVRDTDPENSKMAETYQAEVAAPLLSLVSPDDETSTLKLLVNGKYEDTVVMFVEGTYSMTEDQSEITLTPSTGDPAVTVTKNEDGSYTYKGADGTEVTLTPVSAGKAISFTYKGQVPVPGMEDTMGDLICELYDDNTARLYASAFGTEFDIDAATYEIDMTAYTITFHFEKGGDVTTYATDTSMAFDYAATGIETFGDISQTLTMVNE